MTHYGPVPGLRRPFRRGRSWLRLLFCRCPRGRAWATARSTTGRSPVPPIRMRCIAADPVPELAGRFPAGSDLGPRTARAVVIAQHRRLVVGVAAVRPPAVPQHRGRPGVQTPPSSGSKTPRRLWPSPPTGRPASACSIPARGGALAVLEAARNVACTGARPMALVNCLNFGNPEHPEVMWQFAEVVDGDVPDACRALGMPVIGNVSFYNESGGADIHPTPVVGVVGLIDRLDSPVPPAALAAGQAVVVLGDTAAELGGSEWAAGRARPPRRAAAGRRPGRRARAPRPRRGAGRRAGGGPAYTTAPTAAWPWPWPRWPSPAAAASKWRPRAAWPDWCRPRPASRSRPTGWCWPSTRPGSTASCPGRSAAGVPATPIGTTGGGRLFGGAAPSTSASMRHIAPGATPAAVGPCRWRAARRLIQGRRASRASRRWSGNSRSPRAVPRARSGL